MTDETDPTEFTEREKAIIEMGLLHLVTDSHVNGSFDVASEGRKVANKVEEWRDDDAQNIEVGL